MANIYQRTRPEKTLKSETNYVKKPNILLSIVFLLSRLNITKKTGILPGTRTELSTEEGKHGTVIL